MKKLNIIKANKPVEEISKSELKKALKTMDDLDKWREDNPLINPELNQFGDPHPHDGEERIMISYDALV